MQRFGMTVPLTDVPLLEQREWIRELADSGYTDLWTGEADAYDAFTPLALASVWAPELRLGTAIVPAFTRGPACLAQSAASLAQAAPGRFVLGIGSSSDVIVGRWNGLDFDRPLQRTRDMVRFCRSALAGEKVTERYETFEVDGFRLAIRPPEPVPILVAALRPGMLRLAGSVGDGAIVNWLSPDDVRTVAPYVNEGGANKEIVARVFVCVSDDAEAVRTQARYMIAAYLNVPVYAAFHEWLGRGEQLRGMWDAWAAGDRKAALAAIPDSVVDDLIVWGPPERCRERIESYRANGVTTPVVALMHPGSEALSVSRALALR